jgi:hypothetical protein
MGALPRVAGQHDGDASRSARSNVSKFRKKPVVIDAFQWTGANSVEVVAWHLSFGPVAEKFNFDPHESVGIPTLEGVTIASKGDWLIRGVKGEFYACKPDIFAATYEVVADPLCPGCEAFERGFQHAPHSAVCGR